MREFLLVDDDWPGPGDDAWTVIVPNAVSKPELLSFYAAELGFPEHFGHNWDAFEECIRDLSWIDHSHLWLRHVGLPLQPSPADLTTYLAILGDAVRYWSDDGSRRLSVSFPSHLRAAIESFAPRGRR